MAPRRPRPELRDRKAKVILEAAAAVFAERGFRTARVADVAERAGIGKGTVYEYFRSKEDLFLHLFDWHMSGLLTSTLEELESFQGSSVDALRRATETLLAGCRDLLPLYPLTMEFWSASTAPEFKERLVDEFRDLYRRFRAGLAAAIRTGMAGGELGTHVDPEAVAAVLVGAFDGLFLQAWFDPSFDPVKAGRHFLDIVISGMSADRSPDGRTSPSQDRRGGET